MTSTQSMYAVCLESHPDSATGFINGSTFARGKKNSQVFVRAVYVRILTVPRKLWHDMGSVSTRRVARPCTRGVICGTWYKHYILIYIIEVMRGFYRRVTPTFSASYYIDPSETRTSSSSQSYFPFFSLLAIPDSPRTPIALLYPRGNLFPQR